jgi:hypothetical protein
MVKNKNKNKKTKRWASGNKKLDNGGKMAQSPASLL